MLWRSMRFPAILFDWRGTLFHDEAPVDWIRASALAIGCSLTESELTEVVERISLADHLPEVKAPSFRQDISLELNAAPPSVGEAMKLVTLLRPRVAGIMNEKAVSHSISWSNQEAIALRRFGGHI